MCDCNKIKNRKNIKLKIQHINFTTNTIQIKSQWEYRLNWALGYFSPPSISLPFTLNMPLQKIIILPSILIPLTISTLTYVQCNVRV